MFSAFNQLANPTINYGLHSMTLDEAVLGTAMFGDKTEFNEFSHMLRAHEKRTTELVELHGLIDDVAGQVIHGPAPKLGR